MTTDVEGWLRSQACTAGRRRAIVKRIAGLTDLPHVSRVLDVGCGPGLYSDLMLRQLRPAGVVGVDLNACAVSIAQQRARHERQENALFLRADGRNLPFARGTFSMSLLAFVLHQNSDWRTLLDEANRVCGGEGTIAVLTLSHQQIRDFFLASVLPEVVSTNLARYPRVDELRHSLGEAGRASIQAELAFDVSLTPDEVAGLVEEGSSAMHATLPPEERQRRVRSHLASFRPRVQFTVGYTLIVAGRRID